jgi:GR25 family glycosyltransferase involved in LPS biosynthesis
MSHYALWQHCVEERQPILIFEDDAVLRRDFSDRVRELVASLEEGWDIIRLGYNCDSIIDIRMTAFCDLRGWFSVKSPSEEQLAEFARSSEPVHLFRLNNAFGICGYLISPKGARILLKRCFPLERRLINVPALHRSVLVEGNDYMMNAVYREIRAYACDPPLVMVANDRTASTIQTSRQLTLPRAS